MARALSHLHTALSHYMLDQIVGLSLPSACLAMTSRAWYGSKKAQGLMYFHLRQQSSEGAARSHLSDVVVVVDAAGGPAAGDDALGQGILQQLLGNDISAVHLCVLTYGTA